MVRVVKRRRQRGTEPQVPRRLCHDRQDRQRIEVGNLPTVSQIRLKAALVDVWDALGVGVETTVETSGFQYACNVGIAFGAEDVVQVGMRVPPGAGVAGGRASLQI